MLKTFGFEKHLVRWIKILLKNQESCIKIENVLRVWRMSDLTIEGKIIIFKALAISKIVHLALINAVPIFTVKQLNIIKNNFI